MPSDKIAVMSTAIYHARRKLNIFGKRRSFSYARPPPQKDRIILKNKKGSLQ
jgi:hypothetical protein